MDVPETTIFPKLALTATPKNARLRQVERVPRLAIIQKHTDNVSKGKANLAHEL